MHHVSNAPKRRKPALTDHDARALAGLSKRDGDDLCRIRQRLGDDVLLRTLAAHLGCHIVPPISNDRRATLPDVPPPPDLRAPALLERLLELCGSDATAIAINLGLLPAGPAHAVGRKAA